LYLYIVKKDAATPEGRDMNALIIAAHGSRNPAFNEEIVQLAGKIAGMAQPFDRVAAAFLQFGSPSIEEQVGSLVEAGVRTIVLFPYFIAAGSHVRQDIPELLGILAAKHPGVQIQTVSHLGRLAGIEDFILRGIAVATP
jgi:sirohydrochlorin ferrochelatase